LCINTKQSNADVKELTGEWKEFRRHFWLQSWQTIRRLASGCAVSWSLAREWNCVLRERGSGD
jgi:hypothetical protein